MNINPRRSSYFDEISNFKEAAEAHPGNDEEKIIGAYLRCEECALEGKEETFDDDVYR